MIAPVDPHLEAFAKAGADIITIHVEAGPHLHRSLQAIRALGKKAGVTMNPARRWRSIEHVIDIVDLVLVMSVNPGYGGQKFIPAAEDKIRRVAALVGGRPIDIEIDGGVTPENAALVTRAGANALVAGSAVFKGGPSDLRGQHLCDPPRGGAGAWRSRVIALHFPNPTYGTRGIGHGRIDRRQVDRRELPQETSATGEFKRVDSSSATASPPTARRASRPSPAAIISTSRTPARGRTAR